MTGKQSIRFFLGANSARGFYSLYDGFTNPAAGDFLWVIKGGPGCGKSTFMKRVGHASEEAGLTVEYIHCSGDPESLDGIYIKEAHLGYVDGTAPHAQECILPGAGGMYLDLGAFYKPEPLIRSRDRLLELNRAYKGRYKRAYGLLQAAEQVRPTAAEETGEAVRRRAEAVGRRYIPAGAGSGEKQRFLSAISCRGRVCLWESAEILCPRICTLDNELGLAGLFLEELRRYCRLQGQPVILCPDPLEPSRAEALLIPGAGLAFAAVERDRPWPGNVWRHLRLDAMAGGDALRRSRGAKRMYTQLMDLATEELTAAKALHDELEAVYNPHVDFAAQRELCELHIDHLLGRME